MKRMSMFQKIMCIGIFFCSVAHAYPNKVTILNQCPSDAIAYVTTLNSNETVKMVHQNEKVTFQGAGAIYTKIKLVGRKVAGGISGASGEIQAFADMEDSLAFTKGFSGEINLIFDAEYKLKAVTPSNGYTANTALDN